MLFTLDDDMQDEPHGALDLQAFLLCGLIGSPRHAGLLKWCVLETLLLFCRLNSKPFAAR
ncbi:hypothetical protein PAXINDRAFT_88267 [Paxillus involutus ATCC 200175]|uniref:Uncharacterized protein n=1 Tax=Paxillus involutus ATCC 200175 TaxID=664439 RepID=A0A0C9TCV9_PAXIN|nr:hypothetical protein PAXINDRAFT_88267 [Paxillus involutus ATCC 200175]